MIIFGKEYKFAYTIGADCALHEMKIDMKNAVSVARHMLTTAVIMNKEYEDIQNMINPEYKQNYLTMEIVSKLHPSKYKELSDEIIQAYKTDSELTVELEPVKKNKRAVRE